MFAVLDVGLEAGELEDIFGHAFAPLAAGAAVGEGLGEGLRGGLEFADLFGGVAELGGEGAEFIFAVFFECGNEGGDVFEFAGDFGLEGGEIGVDEGFFAFEFGGLGLSLLGKFFLRQLEKLLAELLAGGLECLAGEGGEGFAQGGWKLLVMLELGAEVEPADEGAENGAQHEADGKLKHG